MNRIIESKAWKAHFREHEFAVRDFVELAISIVEWSKDFIKEAAQMAGSSEASLAWTGVCLVLLLLLNPKDQDAKRVKAIEDIAVIIRQCALREIGYEHRYVKGMNQDACQDLGSAHSMFRRAMKELYIETLRFEAKCLEFLVQHPAKHLLNDMFK
jgi:hypothetical protein